MLFVITKYDGDPGIPESGIDPAPDYFGWTLYKVVKGEVGKAIAKSPFFFDSEADARSDIATAKIALKAARFAKVRADV